MPAIFAHHAFGVEVALSLPPDRFPEILAHPTAFELGLQGPDPLFYYHPLQENELNRRGDALHSRPAAPFFAAARERQAGNMAARAYLYGFVCHFALDSVCHPAVDACMAKWNISHAAVESAFDRGMIERTGLSRRKVRLGGTLREDEESISSLAAMCDISREQAATCIRSMQHNARRLHAKNGLHAALIRMALRLLRHPSLIDMMLPEQWTASAKDCFETLFACYGRALDKACLLLENYRSHLTEGSPLSPLFDSDYQSEEHL